MKTLRRFVLITLVAAVAAFVLGPIIWPPDAGGPAPGGLQLVLLVALSALESLAFGVGVAFVVNGLPLVRRVTGGSTARTWITFIATAWLLVSWCPHDNMHKHNGTDVGGLIVIEYLFHFSMVLAGGAIAYVMARAFASVPATTTSERGLEQRVVQAVAGD